MIQWSDGLLRSPDGETMRQVPAKHAWSSALWTSKGGQFWRRFYNAVSGEWHWDGEGSVEYVEDEEGRMGVYLDRGWTPIEVAVALAWLHRAPETPMRVTVKEGKPMHTKYIKWVEPEHHEERGPIRGETWKPLKVRCGVVPCPTGYMISSEGRLRNPNGEVTSGYWYEGIAGGTRLAAVRDCGLVDLWIAAKLIPNAVYLQPRLKMTADAMMSGHSPADLARHASIQLDTAWCYFRQVAEHVPVSRLRDIAPTLVDKHLWQLLLDMKAQGDERLGEQLNPLMEIVQDTLPARSAFWRVHGQMGMLGFARLCVLKIV